MNDTPETAGPPLQKQLDEARNNTRIARENALDLRMRLDRVRGELDKVKL